ncbi:sigma-70 family RNA polymerase sigma factor [Knoellia sp. 3-2P3]|uniref:RNA polymerase sigma factor n=1 Tax=unclassified Knoellia TaxID=2618719 RepID=UPI0023DC92D9|nr:sigma-70 family RNA polymerase sigma factor [Knoellia sp. 3-2P3]MDF2092231.1 sigma-70 family RNA polymerase sigma factor [Knoellia sp. 3-2P3]
MSTDLGPRTRPPEPQDWIAALTTPGPEQTAALRQLHGLMVRAAAHQVWRLRHALPDPSPAAVDDIVNQAADEAMASLLGKLHTFEGRSRFTTWAFKFAIVQAGTDVRRLQWQHRQVELGDLDVPAKAGEGPEQQAEATDLARAVADAMRRRLTPYQRRIAVALLVEQVPIDVLAERLGTTRGALYKTVHDVRSRLRDELTLTGHLDAASVSGRAAPQPSTLRPEAGTP